jgi:hypothetical protein
MEITYTDKFARYSVTKVGVKDDLPDGIALELIRKGLATSGAKREVVIEPVVVRPEPRTVTTASVRVIDAKSIVKAKKKKKTKK